VHTQINVFTPEEVLFFLVQQQQPKIGKNARSRRQQTPKRSTITQGLCLQVGWV
jgi:hypothetical protein